MENRVRGMIYGQCTADAVGLSYKATGPHVAGFPYTDSINEFPPNDWTGYSDMMIVVMRSLTGDGGPSLASLMKDYAACGFSELGDSSGRCSKVLKFIIGHEGFAANPFEVARDFYSKSNGSFATNECLLRTAPLSISRELTAESSASLCAVTHADARCLSACCLVNSVLCDVIHSPEKPIDQVLVTAIKAAKVHMNADIEAEFSAAIRTAYTTIPDMYSRANYVMQALGCFLYVLQILRAAQSSGRVPAFKKVVHKIASWGGDQPANCGLSGALLGAYLGHNMLPRDWLDAPPNAWWLSTLLDGFVRTHVA